MGGFAEEKTYFINLYSREIALYLYEAINAYVTTLDAGDPSLGDVHRWALHLFMVMPGHEPTLRLLENLKQKQQY